MAPRVAGAAALAWAPTFLPLALGSVVVAPNASTALTPGSQPGCIWPNCTYGCQGCASVPFTTCLIPLPFDSCGPNAKCGNRLCLCSPGFCHYSGADGCVPAACHNGAYPPPYHPSWWSTQFSSLGPEVPRSSEREEWAAFALDTAHLPAVVFVLGIAIATVTCIFVSGVEENTLFDCLPVTPYLLLFCSVLALLIVVFGIARQHVAMVGVFDVAKSQLRSLHADIKNVSGRITVLNATCANLSVSFFKLPESCDHAVAFSRAGSQLVVDRGGKYVDQVVREISKFSSSLVSLDAKISLAEDLSSSFETVIIGMPILPVLCMVCVTAAIVIITLVSWFHHDPEVADEADDAFFRYGGCCITTLIISTGALAAAYLWTGIAEGAMCMNVDENIVNIVSDVNFTKVGNVSQAVELLIDQALEHYILGTAANPLVTKISEVENMLNELLGVWNNTHMIVSAASEVCKGLKNFNVPGTIGQVEAALQTAKGLLHASTIWPYYQQIMHHLICGSLIQAQGWLVTINVVVGLVFFPLLALIAHADLDRWSHWKSQNSRGSRARGQRPRRRHLGKSWHQEEDSEEESETLPPSQEKLWLMSDPQQMPQRLPMQQYPIGPAGVPYMAWQGMGYSPMPGYAAPGGYNAYNFGHSARMMTPASTALGPAPLGSNPPSVFPSSASMGQGFLEATAADGVFPSPKAGWPSKVPGD